MADGMSVWEIAQHALIDGGIDTYAPAQHKGDCKTPYVVLRIDGATPVLNFSSQQAYYTVLCYAPDFKTLLALVEQCKAVMAREPIFPMLMPTGIETPVFFDDTNNSYMISVQYRNNVRNNHL